MFFSGFFVWIASASTRRARNERADASMAATHWARWGELRSEAVGRCAFRVQLWMFVQNGTNGINLIFMAAFGQLFLNGFVNCNLMLRDDRQDCRFNVFLRGKWRVT